MSVHKSLATIGVEEGAGVSDPLDLEIWHFLITLFCKKILFAYFWAEKMKFHHFWLPMKKSFWRPVKNSLFGRKYFRHPCLRQSKGTTMRVKCNFLCSFLFWKILIISFKATTKKEIVASALCSANWKIYAVMVVEFASDLTRGDSRSATSFGSSHDWCWLTLNATVRDLHQLNFHLIQCGLVLRLFCDVGYTTVNEKYS